MNKGVKELTEGKEERGKIGVTEWSKEWTGKGWQRENKSDKRRREQDYNSQIVQEKHQGEKEELGMWILSDS